MPSFLSNCVTGLLVCLAVLAAGSPARADESAFSSLVELLGEIEDDEFRLDLLDGIHQALNGRRRVAMPESWPDVSAKLAGSEHPLVRERALLLSLIFGDPKAATALRKTAADDTVERGARERALAALTLERDPATLDLLKEMLAAGDLPGPVLSGLAAYNDPEIPALILRRYDSYSDAEKRQAVGGLAGRKAWAKALLDAVAEGRVPQTDVSAYTVRQLTALGDPQLNAQLEEVWGSIRPTSADKAALIARYKQTLKQAALDSADLSAGRAVFEKNCAGCHKLFGTGRAVGPELTGAQRSNLDYLLENLLDPNAIVGRTFQLTTIVTAQGRVLTGIVTRETDRALTLQTPTDELILSKSDVDARSQARVSMMPEGMLQKLSADELRDLVGYLGSPEQVPLPGSGE